MAEGGPRSRYARFAPLFLVAAVLGAFAMTERELPRHRDVVIDVGEAAADVRDIELSWTRARAGTEEAQVTTKWHFAMGTAPARLQAGVKLPDGEWEVEVGVERYGTLGTSRWSGRINLERTPWWKRDDLGESPVYLPVRQALR